MGFTRAIQSVAYVLRPDGNGEDLVDLVYSRRYLAENGPQIVVIGGGTGLSTLLRGLKIPGQTDGRGHGSRRRRQLRQVAR